MIIEKYLRWWLEGIIIEKDCDDGKRLWSLKGIMIIKRYWLLKGIMIIEKYCDYWKMLWSLKGIIIIENIVIIEKYYDWKILWSKLLVMRKI